jgi:Holliday junction resolvase-like predicted endonuclease
LRQQGLQITARNVEVPGGEIDLLALDGRTRVAVEVRTVSGAGDPIDAVDGAKRRHVTRLARRAGADRIDFLGVALRPWGAELHWLPG